MLDWMFFTSDQEPGVQLLVLFIYDLSLLVRVIRAMLFWS